MWHPSILTVNWFNDESLNLNIIVVQYSFLIRPISNLNIDRFDLKVNRIN